MIDLIDEQWGPEAEGMLAVICEGDETGGVANIRRQVVQGGATLLRAWSEVRGLVGYMVVRIDEFAAGRELVVVAAAGRLAGVNLIESVWGQVEGIAKVAGCKWVRVHTDRQGMLKRLAALGFEFSEWVTRKAIA